MSEKTALNKLTFGIKQREIFGLVGPNGSGKSTLIGLITQQLESDSGSFMVEAVESRSATSSRTYNETRAP